MLAAVRWGAVALGAAAGALAATVASLALWPVLELANVEGAPLAALTAGVLFGFAVAGYLAGRLAPFLARFHGALAGFGLVVLVVVTTRLGGSPAPTGQVVLLTVLGTVLGGVAGTVAGRRHPKAGNIRSG